MLLDPFGGFDPKLELTRKCSQGTCNSIEKTAGACTWKQNTKLEPYEAKTEKDPWRDVRYSFISTENPQS